MALEAAAQLLTTVLMLLQTVSANPSLPQSTRDGAEALAQRAITEASRSMTLPAAAGAPSCTLISDKFNYSEGEIILFSWQTMNATTAKFLPNTSGKESLQTPDIELVESGIWRKAATVRGYPFVTIQVTGVNGAKAACSHMVNVQ